MKKTLFFVLNILLFTNIFAERISFSANEMSGQTNSNDTQTSLKGNAYIKTETMEIQADEISLSGENYKNILATGNINGKNLETNMEFTCNKLEYDRNTKIAILKGDVNLTDKDNDVNAQAQIIEYNQEKDIAILQIQINLTQKDNICKASYGVYNKKQQILELSGNASVKQNENLFRAQLIQLNMETQDISLDGSVKGTITTKAKENTQETIQE